MEKSIRFDFSLTDIDDNIHSSRKSVNFEADGKDANNNFLTGFETQEIMLFMCSQVILNLSTDSPKIRDILGNELRAYWSSIVSVINMICPNKVLPASASILTPKTENLDSEAYKFQKRLSHYTAIEVSAPLYGMSEATWEIVILTKGVIYDIMHVLGNTVDKELLDILDNSVTPEFLHHDVAMDTDGTSTDTDTTPRFDDTPSKRAQKVALIRNKSSSSSRDNNSSNNNSSSSSSKTGSPFRHRYDNRQQRDDKNNNENDE